MSNIELPPLPQIFGVLLSNPQFKDAIEGYARAAVELNQNSFAKHFKALYGFEPDPKLDMPASTGVEDEFGALSFKGGDELRKQLKPWKCEMPGCEIHSVGTTDIYHEPGLGLNKGDY